MRIVVDTNVFVEARFDRKKDEAAWRIIRECLEGRLKLVYTNTMTEEAMRVLEGVGASDDLRGKVYRAFAQGEELSDVARHAVCADPTDNVFIECAVAGKVPYIISRDKALRNLDGYEGIKVRTASEFYQENSDLRRRTQKSGEPGAP